MQAHAACSRLPVRPGAVPAESGKLLPVLPAIGRAEHCRVFNARIDRIRILQRGLKMPNPFELPWMCSAVVPLVRAGNTVIGELIPDRLPGLPAIVRALDQLPEPAARLRCI